MGRDRTFSHRDAGTSEAVWLLDARWDAVARLGLADILDSYPNVVVIAPHPDDESLALGATIADLAGSGVSVTVVVVTHGGDAEQSSPRRDEATRAVAALSPGVRLVWWNFPDGALDAHETDIAERLVGVIDGRTLVLAPVDDDGHGDHEAVARAAENAVRQRNAGLLCYPVWLWHWAGPDDVDWARLRVVAPSRGGLLAKSTAINCYTSQLTAQDGHPIVGPAVVSRAQRVFETLMVPRAADLAIRVEGQVAKPRGRAAVAASFDAMFAHGDIDPWRLDSSFYERRRLALVLACLGRGQYRSSLEIGCSTGQLSQMLTSRVDKVAGMDASSSALRVARDRCPEVAWILGAAPADIPQQSYDLIVLSEVAYFLDGPDLLTTLRSIHRRLRPGGEIVLAHWRAATSDIPLDGELAHRQATAVIDLPLRSSYQDADLTIQIWGEPVSVHEQSEATA